MVNLNAMRNKFIDKTVNLLNTVKYVPNVHDEAIDKIINNPKLTDDQKLTQMRDYFRNTVAEDIFDQAITKAQRKAKKLAKANA